MLSGSQSSSLGSSSSPEPRQKDPPDGTDYVFCKEEVYVHPSGPYKDGIPGYLALIKEGGEVLLAWRPYQIVCHQLSGNHSFVDLQSSSNAQTSTSSDHAVRHISDSPPPGPASSSPSTPPTSTGVPSLSAPTASLTSSSSSVGPSSTSADLYSLRIPLSEVHSIRRYVPTIGIGWPYVIVVARSGIAFPPYYFHDGSWKEFLASVSQLVSLSRSSLDNNLFYVNHQKWSPLAQQQSSSIAGASSRPTQGEVSSRQPLAATSPLPQGASTQQRPQQQQQQQQQQHRQQPQQQQQQWNRPSHASHNSSAGSTVTTPPSPLSMRPDAGPVSHQLTSSEYQSQMDGNLVPWTLLQKFSNVTRAARDGLGWFDSQAASRSRHFESTVQSLLQPGEPEKQSVRLSHATDIGKFEVLGSSVSLEDVQSDGLLRAKKCAPLSADEWISAFDHDGRIGAERAIRKRIFEGGVEPALRIEVWKYLLRYYEFNSTHEERVLLRKRKHAEYASLKSQWQSISAEQESHHAKFRDRRHRIEKDVVRTDRTLPEYVDDDSPHLKQLHDILLSYCFFNWDLGYVQGMNDLLSPILLTMEDEADAFWCFKGLMDNLMSNFYKDQSGIHRQLMQLTNLVKNLDKEFYGYLESKECLNMFFCFRWVLIQFKREFSPSDLNLLWEAIWSEHYTKLFHLFVAVGILLRYRNHIMRNELEFDDILKFTNNLSNKLPLHSTLLEGEVAYKRFIRCCDEAKQPIDLSASLYTRDSDESDLLNCAPSPSLPVRSAAGQRVKGRP